MLHRFGPIFVVVATILVGGCAADQPPLILEPHVDLQRYSGRWYIAANIPYFAESGKIGSYFDVSFPEEGDVLDAWHGRKGSFDADLESFTMRGYVVPGSGNARWRESPFWPLYFSYLILYVDPDYQTALVGYPGRGYGWVLSRKPDLDEATYASLLARFKDAGYDVGQFRRIPQSPAEIGKPGFQ